MTISAISAQVLAALSTPAMMTGLAVVTSAALGYMTYSWFFKSSKERKTDDVPPAVTASKKSFLSKAGSFLYNYTIGLVVSALKTVYDYTLGIVVNFVAGLFSSKEEEGSVSEKSFLSKVGSFLYNYTIGLVVSALKTVYDYTLGIVVNFVAGLFSSKESKVTVEDLFGQQPEVAIPEVVPSKSNAFVMVPAEDADQNHAENEQTGFMQRIIDTVRNTLVQVLVLEEKLFVFETRLSAFENRLQALESQKAASDEVLSVDLSKTTPASVENVGVEVGKGQESVESQPTDTADTPNPQTETSSGRSSLTV